MRRRLAQIGVSDDGRDLRPIIDAVKARSRTILQVAERVAVRLDPSRSSLDEKGAALIRKMGPAFSVNLLRAVEAARTQRDRAREGCRMPRWRGA